MILQANSLPVARSMQRWTVEVEPTPVVVVRSDGFVDGWVG